MGDNDEGHAECAVQFQKQFGDGIAGPLVQVAGRLVGQQHAGLQQDSPRNGVNRKNEAGVFVTEIMLPL